MWGLFKLDYKEKLEQSLKMKLFAIRLVVLLSFTMVGLTLSAQPNGQKEVGFYVSPTGSDSNSGTKEQPLASLIGARNAIRLYKSIHSEPTSFTVWIANGRYEMTEPLVLSPEDGGADSLHAVVYKALPGASPLFSGGRRITGFKKGENGVWEVKLFESTYYKWRFDQLYVNGKRATLARTPNEGFLKIGRVKENVWDKGAGRIAERAEQLLTFGGEDAKALQDIDSKDLDLVRFRAFHNWDFTLRYVDKVDKDSSRIYTSGRGMKPWNPLKKDGRVVLENYREALDANGEWFLNSQGTLFYQPREGEVLEDADVVAPVLGNLITISGDATNDDLVKHVRFEGLRFSHSHYAIPRVGIEPNQAAVSINAAIMLEGVSNISFKDCEVSQTGQHAIWFGKGSSNSTVEHCYLNDLGGGGIYISDFVPREGKEHTHHIRVHNNILHAGGREFPSAVGVWIGQGSDNEVTHNDIGDFFYSGVSVGWTWGYTPSSAKRNRIAFNNIHHIGWTLLSDMAGVYTLGQSEGTIINNNVVHHISAYSYGGWGLYTDEGSSDIVMENNLVYNTKTGGFHQHYGKNNIIRNNIFAFARKYQIQATRVEKHRSFDFMNNIVVFDEGVVLKGAWDKFDIKMDYNLYWNTDGDKYDFAGKTFEAWKQTGHDSHSIIADPYFKDLKAFDFTFQKRKNINRIKFKPFDYSKAGVYGDANWKEKAKLSAETLRLFDAEVQANDIVE